MQFSKEVIDYLAAMGKRRSDELAETMSARAAYVPKGKTVFLGDSITEGFAVAELLSEYTIFNRGIGGDTTDGVLKRLQGNVCDLMPSKVFILIGTNDIGMGVGLNEIASNVQKIVGQIKTQCPECQIFLQSVYPVNAQKVCSQNQVSIRTNDKIDALNKLLKGIDGITYIDAAYHLKDSEGKLKENYTVDGLHLSIEGYLAVVDILKPYLE